jgi:hypothetical protein
MLDVSRHRALKNILKLPQTTRSKVIYNLSGKHPVEVEFI